jgi:hypothetical protein
LHLHPGDSPPGQQPPGGGGELVFVCGCGLGGVAQAQADLVAGPVPHGLGRDELIIEVYVHTHIRTVDSGSRSFAPTARGCSMLSGLVEHSAGGAVDAPRRFFVVWQNPETREFHRVGRLEAWPDNSCRFAYASDVRAVPGFRPFAAFPEMEHEYVAERLFPFFANRVMSARRPDFEAYLTLLGLGPQEWTPLEVVA